MQCHSEVLTIQMKTRGLVVTAMFLLPWLCEAQDSQDLGTKPLTTTSLAAIQPDAAQIVPGRLIHQVDPKYPKEARKANLQGQIVLRATIGSDGKVSNVSIASGDLVLAEEAVDAVRKWKFTPYTQNGTPVGVLQSLTFNFVAGTKVAELKPLSPATFEAAQSSTIRKGVSSSESVFRVGHGVTPPKAIYAPDPGYDEKARKAKYQGTCVLSLVVGSDGQPRDIRVERAIGKGLDAKAVEAVSKWKFQPATKDGEPVATLINVEVTFHLY
jgi:TonB family protein